MSLTLLRGTVLVAGLDGTVALAFGDDLWVGSVRDDEAHIVGVACPL